MLRIFPRRGGRGSAPPGALDGSPASPADPGIDAVLAAEAMVAAEQTAAAEAAATDPAALAGPEAPADPAASDASADPEASEASADPDALADGAAAKKSGAGRAVFDTLRELLRAIATAYVSAYVSLVIWSMLPMVFGWTPTVVISGSMRPVINVGDVVFFAPEEARTIALGRVILVDDPDRPGHLLSHRLYERNDDGTLITKGDANASPDSTPVRPDQVRGAARLVIPFVGRVTLWRGDNRSQAIVWTGITGAALLMARSPGRLTPAAPVAPAAPDGQGAPPIPAQAGPPEGRKRGRRDRGESPSDAETTGR